MIRIYLIGLYLLLSMKNGRGQEAKLVLPIGHTQAILYTQFSYDGNWVITTSSDNTAKVWDSKSGKLFFDLKGHDSKVLSAQFSIDNKKVITFSEKNSAIVWNLANGDLLFDLKAKNEPGRVFRMVDVSLDCKRLLALTGYIVSVWDTENGIKLYDLNRQDINYAIFSPNGKEIITTSINGVGCIWNSENGNKRLELKKIESKLDRPRFSSDGKKIVSFTNRDNLVVIDAQNGALVSEKIAHKYSFHTFRFSPDNQKVLTISRDGTAEVWNINSGKLLFEVENPRKKNIVSGDFSPDGNLIFTSCYDSIGRFCDPKSGSRLFEIKFSYPDYYGSQCEFSRDGKKLFTESGEIWDLQKGALLFDVKEFVPGYHETQFSPDGKRVAINEYNSSYSQLMDIEKEIFHRLVGKSISVLHAQFSPNNKQVVTYSGDNTIKFWDADKSKLLFYLKPFDIFKKDITFSADGKIFMIRPNAQVWNAETGSVLFDLKEHSGRLFTFQFSPDGKKIATSSTDGSTKIWDATNGAFLFSLHSQTSRTQVLRFSNDSKKLVTSDLNHRVRIWNVENGEMLIDIKIYWPPNATEINPEFSNDDKRILALTTEDSLLIIDSENGKTIVGLKSQRRGFKSAHFSPDGKTIVTTCYSFMTNGRSTNLYDLLTVWNSETGARMWGIQAGPLSREFEAHFSPDSKTLLVFETPRGYLEEFIRNATVFWPNVYETKGGKWLYQLKGHTSSINSAQFSADGRKILTSSEDNTTKIWDVESRSLLYTSFNVDTTDYLVIDKDYHFDGTIAARRLLYFTCGSEIVDLEQLKESLWVPDLVERINRGEKINAPKLSDLNLCGLTPIVTPKNSPTGTYSFSITPRRGGLGETHLLVNGNITKRYQPNQLKKTSEGYELAIPKSELEAYLIQGQDNPLTVKAYTSTNTISSRGGRESANSSNTRTIPPNLYAVVIGVGNYKGEELKLKYAAKDAQDMAELISLSCKKFLNTDGKEHVFIYNYNTGEKRTGYPEKVNIKHVFDTIASKATANDILLLFFAGHGVVEGTDKKQFYLLTSDASSFNNVANTGISTLELIDWIKPERIKAQKRIMILDACNSAAAINEISQNQQFIAVRNTSSSEQKREIERLNDQAGMFVLSASASNQSAYEMGRFSQGLLTYALLKAIKLQPDILVDKKYLNLTRWFSEAKRSVNDIMNQSGNLGRQDPQMIANTDINIGIVDQEVIDKIKLADEKPIFTRSEFRNTVNRVDNLKLRPLVDKLITDHSRGVDNKLLYQGDYEGSEAYSFSGDYTVSGNDATVSVFLIKGGTEIINKSAWVFKGKTDQLETLALEIVKKGIENIPKK